MWIPQSIHMCDLPLKSEIRPDESFVELDTPPPTPQPVPEALLQALQPILSTNDFAALLEEAEKGLEESPEPSLRERSDFLAAPQTSASSHYSPSSSFFTDTSIGGGLPAPPRHRLSRLDTQSERHYSPTPNAAGRRRRPSPIYTAPASTVSSPTWTVTQESPNIYNIHMMEGNSALRRVENAPPPVPQDVSSEDARESWAVSPSSSPDQLVHYPSFESIGDVTRNVEAAQRRRHLLSQAIRRSNSNSTFSSSEESLNAPSTIHEPRISVSSTVYPDSLYEERMSVSPAHTGTDEFGARQPRPHSNTPSEALSSISQTVQEPESPTTTLHRPVGAYPDNNSFSISKESVPQPRSTDQVKQFLVPKPAIPTTPKPDFRRSRSVQPDYRTSIVLNPPSPPTLSTAVASVSHLHDGFPLSHQNRGRSVPPTTNHLNSQERSNLIRKSRKLTQLFGQTPSPISGPGSLSDSQVPNSMLLPIASTRRVHSRNASEYQHRTTSPDRMGSLSPIRFRNTRVVDNDSDDATSPVDSPDMVNTPMSSSRRSNTDGNVRSPTIVTGRDSFMEMSDFDDRGLKRMSSMLSLMENLTPDQIAEEEKRKKREKVAKLHRFLGSRVPMELVVTSAPGAPLPPLIPTYGLSAVSSDTENPFQAKLFPRIRRNSIAGSEPFDRLPEVERKKEDLSDKEKAIVVKRAMKMERMFGEQPPQDLLRVASGSSVGQSLLVLANSAPSSPCSNTLSKSLQRKNKVSDASDHSESERRLLDTSIDSDGARSLLEGVSDVYMHYRSSLVSLASIVDNDDRKSLAELHEYMNEDNATETQSKRDSHSTILSDRRRSLPARASIASLLSQYTLGEPSEGNSPFEVRRRRAAKLTQFFGVQYRDLFGDVLDSIENSVREDEGKGTLNTAEAQDLLVHLSQLRSRKHELS